MANRQGADSFAIACKCGHKNIVELFFKKRETLIDQMNPRSMARLYTFAVDQKMWEIARYCRDKIVGKNFNQHALLTKLTLYMKDRSNGVQEMRSGGYCHGLTHLYLYYQFMNREGEFYRRITRAHEIEITEKEAEKLSEKCWGQLSEEEQELEGLCNDLIYLHQFVNDEWIQQRIVPALTSVSENQEIGKLQSRATLSAIFPYDQVKKAHATFEEALMQVLLTSPSIDKGVTVTFETEVSGHIVGFFCRGEHFYFYDSENCSRAEPHLVNLENIHAAVEILKKNGDIEGQAVCFSLDVISPAPLQGLEELFSGIRKESLFMERRGVLPTGSATPLMWAAHTGFEDEVERILGAKDEEERREVNLQDRQGASPLMGAVAKGHYSSVKLLLSVPGIALNSKGNMGTSALHLATAPAHSSICELLLQAPGIDCDPVDKQGVTPLWYAAQEGSLEVVRQLLQTGKVNIHHLTPAGTSVLRIALLSEEIGVMRLLLEAGAGERLSTSEREEIHTLLEKKRYSPFKPLFEEMKIC